MKMKKEKQNEYALAELGDTLMQEKVKLEEKILIIDRKIKELDKKIETGKKRKKQVAINIYFFKFVAQNEGFIVMKRLEEINKELKNDK
jgi:hypothetical protein